MPSLGPTELIIILVIAILIFGAGRVADVGGALGKSVREFRKATNDDPRADPPAPSTGSAPVPAALPSDATPADPRA